MLLKIKKLKTMNEEELLYKAMVNSYNVITERDTIENIEKVGMPIFVHLPENGVDKVSLKIITMYFIMDEEYERCEELRKRYNGLFNEEMPSVACKCSTPDYYMDDDHMICRKCKEVII